MSHKRLMWEEVSQLAAGIAHRGSLGASELGQLAEHIGRLAKVQYKANALQEATLEQQRVTLATLQATTARQEEIIAALHHNHRRDIDLARHDLLLAMLPVLDGLDAALQNGRRQMTQMASASQAKTALSGWLDGLRLVHQRMLDILSQADVEPIPAVGQRFDPRLHVAADVDTSGHTPAGMVVGEERRGYRTRDGVLRYAEVVVARPASPASEPATARTPEVGEVPDSFSNIAAD